MIDAVSIVTMWDQHTDPTIAALEAGKHVFLEKPMASTVEDCRKIIAAAKKAKGILQIGHICRFEADSAPGLDGRQHAAQMHGAASVGAAVAGVGGPGLGPGPLQPAADLLICGGLARSGQIQTECPAQIRAQIDLRIERGLGPAAAERVHGMSSCR